MIALKERQGSFADSVIAALGFRVGCPCMPTFDHTGGAAMRLRTPLICVSEHVNLWQ
jgi:hypothetical protein